MALPSQLQPGLLPSEVEFLATSTEHVHVVPLVRIDRVRLLSGVYGPLRPPTQARVPLWLALNLKKRRKCHIVCPEWLHIDNLRTLLRSEQSNAAFASVPPFYQAIAKVLLESAPDDVPAADDVREALKSLREARQSKVLAGLEMINADHLEMTNISRGEITELRHFFADAFEHLRALQRAAHEPDGPGGAGAGVEAGAAAAAAAAGAGAGAAGGIGGSMGEGAMGHDWSFSASGTGAYDTTTATTMSAGAGGDRGDTTLATSYALDDSREAAAARKARASSPSRQPHGADRGQDSQQQQQDSMDQNSMDLF